MADGAAPFVCHLNIAGRDEEVALSEPLDGQSVRDYEQRCIEARRGQLGRQDAGPVKDTLTGLAFSGGGIRASTFCLGVAQALDQFGILQRIDYLSTVSGGGYFGSSLTATMRETEGQFVFGGIRSASEPADHPPQSELADTPAVGHLRNFSNYLVPRGLWDAITGAAVIVRGLAANAALVFWLVLLLAALTVFSNPDRPSLMQPGFFRLPVPWPPVKYFGLTLLVAAAAFLYFLGWAIRRSRRRSGRLSDATGVSPRNGALVLLLIGVVALCELQPFAIELLFKGAEPAKHAGGTGGSLLSWLGVLLAPLTAAVTFFRDTLKTYLANTSYSAAYSTLLGRVMAKAALFAGAAALPVLIWIFYLHLCYWAIAAGPGSGAFDHSPAWLSGLRAWAGGIAWLPYLVLGLALLVTASFLKPNANSPHHLYRDRLARAFHFQPATFDPGVAAPPDDAERPSKAGDGERPLPLLLKLTSLSSVFAPYHLINTAINVHSSTEANRRGRNADFFLLSPLFVGSRVTGYVPTCLYEKTREAIDLATAVAVSGAAASSDMGARTVRILSPTLAILNIRLGYWLLNPRAVLARLTHPDRNGRPRMRDTSHFFLAAEAFGIMREDDRRVYLTDGGHIENLGIYELLRRRCKVIVAVDAEADPQMRFGSFVTLQIYARIDLGVRIDMPLQRMRDITVATMAGQPPAGDEPMLSGPHVAIGRIDYGGGAFGTLVYIKASLTGDENDYVSDYVRRNPSFPHETTGDQFFSEEQFEVYRALGFHAAFRFFKGEDIGMVANTGAGEPKRIGADDGLLAIVRELLLPGSAAPAPPAPGGAGA